MQLQENEKMISSLENTITDLEDMVTQSRQETEQTNLQVQATKKASKTMVQLQESATLMLLACLQNIQEEKTSNDDSNAVDARLGDLEDRAMFKVTIVVQMLDTLPILQ